MKKILVWCLVVMFTVFSMNLIGCKPEKPKKPLEQPMVEKPEPPQPHPPRLLPPPEKEFISAIKEVDGTWIIKLNNSATYAIKSKGMKLRLNIGYMTYEVGQTSHGNVIEFTPEWHPGGRVTAGVWNPRAGPGGGKYVSSVFVKNIAPKLPVIKEEIKTEKTEVLPPLPPPPSEITPEEAIKRLHGNQDAAAVPLQGAEIQSQPKADEEKGDTKTPKGDTVLEGTVLKGKLFEDSGAGKSVDKLGEVWK